MSRSTTVHSYRFRLGERLFRLDVRSRPVTVISSEYYFTFSHPRTATAVELDPAAPDPTEAGPAATVPYSYPDGAIRSLFLDLGTGRQLRARALTPMLEAVAERSIQFPILFVQGSPGVRAIEKLLRILDRYARRDDMFFLVYVPIRRFHPAYPRLFGHYRDVHYDSGNRVFLKALLPTGRGARRLESAFLRRGLPFDLYHPIRSFEDLAYPDRERTEAHNGMLERFFDSYSNHEVVHGPNLWIDLRSILPPRAIVEYARRLAGLEANKLFFDTSLHRLFNLLPVRHRTPTSEPPVLTPDGGIWRRRFSTLEHCGQVTEGALDALDPGSGAGCGNDCGDLALFCGGVPSDCQRFKAVALELCRASEASES